MSLPRDDDDEKRKLEEAQRELDVEEEGEREPEPEPKREGEPEAKPTPLPDKGLDFADLVREQAEAEAQGRKPRLRAVEFVLDLGSMLEVRLKDQDNLRGPFSDELRAQFERLKREQPEVFALPGGLDAAMVRVALEKASKDVVELFIAFALVADLNAAEIDALRRLAAEKSGVGLRPLASMLKQAQDEQAVRRAQALKAKRRAGRTDPRPLVHEPEDSDPWIPVMEKINEVLGASLAPEPPARDIDGFLTRTRKMALPGLHLFSTANEQQPDAGALPPPEQWLLRRMGEIEVAELIERQIDYVDADDKPVHLKTTFVKHYVQRDDDALPIVVAIATLPIVLGDGVLLAPDGLDRKRGIIFKVAKELRDVLPRREGCDEEAVREAMRFLCDDWLVDVATDYAGKCIIIAAALTLIERSLLPERPAFFVTAGKSRGGKTTTLNMLIVAVTGERPAAAAWSSDENERRKALLSYFLSGVSYILWDNIPRGEQLSCSHVEKSCTAAFYSDRRLGVSETVATAAATIHLFTGNNIGPRGDLASRSLQARLAVDRPDPENREFKHPDPISWTENNRAEILEKLYTILLGNPMLKQPRDAQGRTRFKTWYRLVGSAVEHAARCAGQELDFQKLFLTQEAEGDEDTSALAEALLVMHRRWPVREFWGSDIASLINREGADSNLPPHVLDEMKRDGGTLRDFLYPEGVSANFVATAKSVGNRLKAHVDEPVQHGQETLVLRARIVHNTLSYFVTKTFDRGNRTPEPPAQPASKPAGAEQAGQPPAWDDSAAKPAIAPIAAWEMDELKQRGFCGDDVFSMAPQRARAILADPERNKLTEKYGKGADAPADTICRVCKKPGARYFGEPDTAGMKAEQANTVYALHLECCPRFFESGLPLED